MLQQTQVTTVIGYFERFMLRFPTVKDLASAEIDEVLHLWSGLGYYARGRNLHHAAQIICADHGGELPICLEDLVALPGIGRSTGSAILAIAHGQRHAILDGNVKRVLTRLQCVAGVPDASATLKQLWPLAEALTPSERVGNYTQAIMDLGATVCTRTKPRCDECPVATLCEAKRTQTQANFPNKKIKKKIPIKQASFLRILNSDGHVLLQKRPPTGIWGGLWCLPELETDKDLMQWCKTLGLQAMGKPIELATLTHTFTHFRLEMLPLELSVEANCSIVMDSDSWLWYNIANPASVGIAKPMTTLLQGKK
jgi:A/G-specific adenine glycosylase